MQLHSDSCSKKFWEFLAQWDDEYVLAMRKIEIFNTELTRNWSQSQKIYFAKLFYHVRGHFHDFLWFLGNHATDKVTKDIVLENISEEFNSSAKSHEQMYIDFATALGADLSDEIVEGKNHLPFIWEYNKDHLRWLANHSPDARFSAFAAYERLDNVDYKYLADLAISLGGPRKSILFFNVHLKAQHFENTERYLLPIWEKNSNCVKDSFKFIAYHQLKMWQNLSDTIFGYNE